MRTPIFAANWKMHLGPTQARQFFAAFFERHRTRADREVWFFPAAVALEAVATSIGGRRGFVVGAQNVHWEPKGAFTGEVSVAMVKEAGAGAALVGHSERRHVFGETIEQTGRKVRAVLAGGLVPLLCVGEQLEDRESGSTLAVVERQLDALDGLNSEHLARVPIAYEPVWAIGTGLTATPTDAADVHASIRRWFADRGVDAGAVRVLYGGSVKPENATELVRHAEIDGVLVGGASVDPHQWADIVDIVVD